MTLITDTIVCLNNERRAAGLPALTPNNLLMQTAQQHADFMATAQVLSHDGANKSTFDERIRKAGYKFSTAAENVALGAVTAEGVVRMWMNSPPHRANILNRQVKDLGLGVAPPEEAGDATVARYWSLSLAAPL